MTSLPIVERIRSLARLHGWGIGEHGSMARDIDLIAVPWTTEASTMRGLINALCTRLELAEEGSIGYRQHGRWSTLLRTHDARIAQIVYPPDKPWGMGIFHGRTYWDPPIIDLSLVDPREVPPPVAEVTT